MATTNVTINDGYMAVYIDSDGKLIWEHDSNIDNVDFTITSTGTLLYEGESDG